MAIHPSSQPANYIEPGSITTACVAAVFIDPHFGITSSGGKRERERIVDDTNYNRGVVSLSIRHWSKSSSFDLPSYSITFWKEQQLDDDGGRKGKVARTNQPNNGERFQQRNLIQNSTQPTPCITVPFAADSTRIKKKAAREREKNRKDQKKKRYRGEEK